jgi:hypothetical protein
MGLSVVVPDLTVVVLRTRSPGARVATSPEAPEILVLRESGDSAPTAAASVSKRLDGPPLLRDWVIAGDALRLGADALGAEAGPGSRSFALARHAAGGWESRSAPPWLLDGLAALVEERAFPDAKKVPVHVCSDQGFGRLSDLLDASKPASPGRVRMTGRLLEALSEAGAGTFAERLRTVAAASDPVAAFEQTFGAEATAAHARVAKAIGRPACDGGFLPCPLCRGGKTVEAACAVCAGLAAVGCPSCGSYSVCPSDTCIDGWHNFVGGKRLRCKYCTGGVVKCRACGNQGRMACRGCSGRGRVTVPCAGCAGAGRVPCGASCAEDGAAPAACPWCSEGTGLRRACEGCGGGGYDGCSACEGTTRVLCDECGGTGVIRMVFKDGTTASASTCSDCEGNGFRRCGECQSGKARCDGCGGTAVLSIDPSECPLCLGEERMPTAERSRNRLALLLGRPTADEVRRNGEMVAKGVRFLLECRDGSGGFTLMKSRHGKTETLDPLEAPTLYSNSDALWTLSVAGIGPGDERVAPAWRMLRRQVREVVETEKDEGIQAVSLALRALVAAGEDPSGAVVKGLVERLCKAQRPDGLWGKTLLSTEKGTAYSALYPVESLRLAAAAGARVPADTWSRALGGALASFDSVRGRGKSDYVSGTDVASATALVLMAKAGSLGGRPGSLDVYRSIPAVQKGVAWLDRHFDVREEPVVCAGARVRDGSDAGYAAYLYAVQRLAQLLSIDVLAGERWHATGARHLASIQRADGSWEERGRRRLNGPVRTTTSAILFLLRATPPLTQTGQAPADAR